MTNQPPYGSYSTSPPWAPPPPPAAPPDAPWGPAAWNGHGGLLVPYPEEMALANRPEPPSWIPVAVWTFLLFPIGFVSARRRARAALIGRNDQHPYWIAFGVTLAVTTVLNLILVFSVALPVYLDYRDKAEAKSVASAIVGAGAADTATCERSGTTTAGLRLYTCQVARDDGHSATVQIQTDAKGHLQPVAG